MAASVAYRLQNPHIWAAQQWDALRSDETPIKERIVRVSTALFLAIATIFTYLMSEAGKAMEKACEPVKGVEGADSIAPLKKKRKLIAVRIEAADYPTAAKTARAWSALAISQSSKAKGSDRRLFSDNASIASSIAHRLSYSSPGQEAYVSKDEFGVEQAMIILTPGYDSVYVNYLATHPRNIRSPLNDSDSDQVSGAGTSLLRHAETRALELGKRRVYLYPLYSAIPFYKKAGYSNTGDEMTKTIEKVAARAELSFLAKAA